MNLHNLRGSTARWIWIAVRCRNGRDLGDHLWFLDEGIAPEMEPAAEHRNDRWWFPQRYRWFPYSATLRQLFNQGWVRPLCDKTSRSIRPYAEMTWRRENQCCHNCRRIALERGIIGHTQSMINDSSEQYRTVNAERTEWEINRNR